VDGLLLCPALNKSCAVHVRVHCLDDVASRGVCQCTVHARRHMYPSEQLVVRIVYMDVCCTWGYHMILVLLGETVIRAGVGVNSLMTDSLA
jgi:hypothetical protein